MQMMLLVDHEKCTGCRTCEVVCSAAHEGASDPARSRIHVVKWEWHGFMMPFTCQQCQDAPCLNACPVKALSRDEKLGRVVHDPDRCIGCRLCITACPFGGMGYDSTEKKVVKCDLCDGDPMCAKFCATHAIQFVDASAASLGKKRSVAESFSERVKQYQIC